MSGIIKVFLLLAVIVCISKAQTNESKQSCLCRRTRNGIIRNLGVKDIQIYPATIFCDKVEIVVTANDNFRYCLNPKISAVKELLLTIMNKKKTTTVTPAHSTSDPTSNSDSTDTAHI